MATQTHYGWRVVCGKCAMAIDSGLLRDTVLADVRLFIALGFLVVAIVLREWLA